MKERDGEGGSKLSVQTSGGSIKSNDAEDDYFLDSNPLTIKKSVLSISFQGKQERWFSKTKVSRPVQIQSVLTRVFEGPEEHIHR